MIRIFSQSYGARKTCHDNDTCKMAQLRRSVEYKTGISQKFLVVRFGCTQRCISRTVKRSQILCLKRTKVPRYKDNAAKGLKSWKHDFEITGDPKVHQLGQLFGRVLRPQTHKGTCGVTPLFRAQKSIKANKA